MARRKNRQQRLERTVALIQHKWGQQAIRKGQPRARSMPSRQPIPTGFPELDLALEIGGIPRGTITTLYGQPTSGKVTLAARVLAQAQNRGRPVAGPVAYIDLAHTCDADYLERCGVRLPDLLVARPEDSRQALDLLLSLAERSELAAILFDTWAGLDGDAGLQRYAAGVLDHLVGRLARSHVALLVLDEPPTLWQRLRGGGSSALDHTAALRLDLSRERWLLSGPDVRGYRAQVAIRKHKFGPTGRQVTIEIHFNGTVRGDGI